MNSQVLNQIKTIVGSDNVMDSEEERLVYAYDGTPMISHKPDAILMPQTTEEISQIIDKRKNKKFRIIETQLILN